MKSSIYKYLSDIRFWILFFFILRLYGITNPPVEVTHSWRQCLTNMQARNFLETDNNILYPRIDMNGEKDGVITGEFPLFNYLIYLWSLLFGYTHWAGRLINLLVSSIGVYFFFKLIRDHFEDKVAFYSTLILLSSLWFSFSRKIMPDTFSVSLVLIGIYFGMSYLFKEEKKKYLVFYFIFCCAGALSKIPSMAIMSVLAIPLFSGQVKMKRKIIFGGISILVLLPISWWYFIWSKYLFEEYGYQLYHYAKTLSEGFRQVFIGYAKQTIQLFCFNSFCGFIASAFFFAGLIIMIFKRNKKLLWVSALIIPPLFLFMIKTGFAFSTHHYYVIPFIPFMALFAGYTLSLIKREWLAVLVLAVICIEGILNQQHDFRKDQKDNYKLKLESIADQLSTPNDLVAVNGDGDPQQMYFLHRRGWNLNEGEIINSVFVDSIANRGCSLLFINKNTFKENLQYVYKSTLYEDDDFIVYNLGVDAKNKE